MRNKFQLKLVTDHTLNIECLAGSNHHICSFPGIICFVIIKCIINSCTLKDINGTINILHAKHQMLPQLLGVIDTG